MQAPNQLPRKQFDKPLFVIRNQVDAEALVEYLKTVFFDSEQWVKDKAGNPLCRATLNNGQHFPERVATICVKRYNMTDEVKSILAEFKGKNPCQSTR